MQPETMRTGDSPYVRLKSIEKIRKEVEAGLPTYQEYIKSRGYIDIPANDMGVVISYKKVQSTPLIDGNDRPLVDIALVIKDSDGVKQILDQEIDMADGRSGATYMIKFSYITENGLRKSKIITLDSDSVNGIKPFLELDREKMGLIDRANQAPGKKIRCTPRDLTLFKN